MAAEEEALPVGDRVAELLEGRGRRGTEAAQVRGRAGLVLAQGIVAGEESTLGGRGTGGCVEAQLGRGQGRPEPSGTG